MLLYEQSDRDASPTIKRQPTTGTAPSPRGLHSAALLNPQTLIVFGGAAQDGTMSNQVFGLNLETFEWTEFQVTTAARKCPDARASPCFVGINDSSMLIFGGAKYKKDGSGLEGCDDTYKLEIDTEEKTCAWERLDTKKSPPGRNAATLTPIECPECLKDDKDRKKKKRPMYFLLCGVVGRPFKRHFRITTCFRFL